MCDFNDFVGKDINDPGRSAGRFRWREVTALKVGVPMEVVAGFCHADEPVDGFESLVRESILIVNSKRRGMRDEDIEGTTIIHFVQHEAGVKLKRPQIGVYLSILIGPVRAILDGSAQAGDQKFFVADQFQVQV